MREVEVGAHTRGAYREQTMRGREAVARWFPAGTRVTRPDGGFLLWVELPGKIDALRLAERALAAGISLGPGPMFSARGEYRNAIRLCCGQPWTPRIEGAFETLGRLAAQR